jgi:TonB family protein
MGRVGLRTALHWSAFFCAVLVTASIPAALAQTHAPKIVPPAPNSALNSAKDSPTPKISAPVEDPSHNSDSPSDPAAPGEVPESVSDSRADDPAAHISNLPSARATTDETPARISDLLSAHATGEPPAHTSELPADVTPADGLPLAGARGVTHPVCLRCPPAQYSYPALIHKVQGNVTLDALVGTDGWVSKVRILGSLGAGLDEQAMRTVRTWQWEPARDAEGKTVAAHQTVVITFHIPQ